MTTFEFVLLVVIALIVLDTRYLLRAFSAPKTIPVLIKQGFETFERTDYCGLFIRAIGEQNFDPDLYSLMRAECEERIELFSPPISTGGYIGGWTQPIDRIDITNCFKKSDPHYIIYLKTKHYPYSSFKENIDDDGYSNVVITHDAEDDVEALAWLKGSCKY